MVNDQTNNLTGKTRPDHLTRFMRKAYAEFSVDYEKLDTLLQDEYWPEASKLAHKLKSVVGLVELADQLPALRSIEAMDLAEISHAEFQQHFRDQYRAGLQKIKQAIGE